MGLLLQEAILTMEERSKCAVIFGRRDYFSTTMRWDWIPPEVSKRTK